MEGCNKSTEERLDSIERKLSAILWFSKHGVRDELNIIRYLISCILLNLYKTQQVNDYNFAIINSLLRKEQNKEKKENPLSSPKGRKENKKEKKLCKRCDTIEFEKFSLKATDYQALVNEYGVEVVTRGAVILDGYLKPTGRTLKDNYKKLKEWAISLAMKERINKQRTAIIMAGKSFDINSIEDRSTALKYIDSIPEYRRNIDKNVQTLIEKFELNKTAEVEENV